jgi:glycosyltransferase involved in cell wall biosynthesis
LAGGGEQVHLSVVKMSYGQNTGSVAPLNVLIVTAWDPLSGVLSVHRTLARELSGRGVRFSAFAFDGWAPDSAWTFCERLIDGTGTTLAEVLMTGDYDLIHCVDTTYSPPWGVEKWVRRARFRGAVVLMASVADRVLTEPSHATAYVACSQAAADTLSADADRRVVVIPNGFDETVFTPGGGALETRKPVLVWVGRAPDERKGLDLFVELLDRRPGLDAVVIDGDPTGLAAEAEVRHLGARVRRLTGLQPDEMAHMYRGAARSGGAFISTSRSEAFGIAAIEAMACRCPVVLPNIPGHAQFVDGVHAVIYERSDGNEGIVRALARLDDPAFREALVESAERAAHELWSGSSMADAYYAVYLEARERASNGKSVTDGVSRLFWRGVLVGRPAWRSARALVGR